MNNEYPAGYTKGGVLVVVQNGSGAEKLNAVMSPTVDVIHWDMVPTWSSGRRYQMIYVSYPRQDWLDLLGETDSSFINRYLAPLSALLLPKGSVVYL